MVRADKLMKNDVIESNEHGDITRYLVKGIHIEDGETIIDCYSLDDLCVYHFNENVFCSELDFYGHIMDDAEE